MLIHDCTSLKGKYVDFQKILSDTCLNIAEWGFVLHSGGGGGGALLMY